MIDTGITFEAYLEKANAAATKEDLFRVYSDTVKRHGLDRVLLGLATDHRDIGEAPGVVFMYNFPSGWMNYYFEKGFDKIDPIIVYSLSQVESFTWQRARKTLDLTTTQKTCLNLGEESGLHNGVCTPLRGPNHAIAGLSLASSEKHDSFDGNLDMITAYSNHFYLAYRRLGAKSGSAEKAGNYALTPKERDVLTHMARGKSQYEAGIILGMSGNTVGWHLKNIFRKLDAYNTTLAVVKALTYGLIHP